MIPSGPLRTQNVQLLMLLNALPLVLPPTVLGYYMLLALAPRSPLGRLAESLLNEALELAGQFQLVKPQALQDVVLEAFHRVS